MDIGLDRYLAARIENQESSAASSMYSCYYVGCGFYTYNERDYRQHGGQKHTKNPLLYPSKSEIEKYGLNPQGKSWEI